MGFEVCARPELRRLVALIGILTADVEAAKGRERIMLREGCLVKGRWWCLEVRETQKAALRKAVLILSNEMRLQTSRVCPAAFMKST